MGSKMELKIVCLTLVFMLNVLLFNPDNTTASNVYNEKQTANELNIEIFLIKKTIKVGGEIIVKCKIKNLSSSKIEIRPIHENNIKFYIKSENDYHPLQSKFFFHEVMDKGSIISIPPNQEYLFQRTISRDYRPFPGRAGKYYLYATLLYSNEYWEDIKLWVGKLTSNVIQFEVVD